MERSDVQIDQKSTSSEIISQEPVLQLWTFQEVAKHSSPSSLWIVINNHVYDVTEFIYKHPGGMEVILEFAGMDATGAFEGKGHSDDAKQLLQKYHIGKLHESDHRG